MQALHQSCRPYPEVFSCVKNAEAMKAHAFPSVKRQPAEKCHGTAEWSQKGSRAPILHFGELEEVVENTKNLTREQVALYSTGEGIVALNKKGIKVAIERRVALFFQQAVLCHGMSRFTFSGGGAQNQIGTSPSMKLSVKKGPSTVHKREAAHSSTTPALIAHAKDGSTPNGFVYLKGGSSYDQHNATVGLNECVNGADELIDGNGQGETLRATAIALYNRVANGLDPARATEEFLQSFQGRITTVLDELEVDDKRRLVLEIYQRKVQKIRLASINKAFYDRLIGVVIHADRPKGEILREVVYQKRYDIIRLQELVESRIGKRIADVKAKMGKQDRSFVEYILLKEFSETKEKKVLEKLLCKTAAIFEAEYRQNDLEAKEKTSLKTFRTRVQNLREKYKGDIANLKRDLRSDFRELSSAEFSYRAGLFKSLRARVHDWSQAEFSAEYLAKTGKRISQSWVSRMEQLSRVPTKDPDSYRTPLNQRRKYLTVEEARRSAETFDVDAGMFLPCLFTS